MSDFLFSSRPRPAGELAGVLGRWLAAAGGEAEERSGPWGTLAVLRPAHADPPLHEDDGGVTAIVGDPLAHLGREGSGPAAEPERRGALHRLLLGGRSDGWDDRLDGPFAAIAVDPAGRGVVATDLFAWIPVFETESPDGEIVAGTHVDAVAEAAGASGELDPVAAVEMMGYYTIAFPRTLYPRVRQVPPGSTLRFGPEGWTGPARSYWEPAERDPYRSLDEAAEALRAALIADVRLALAARGHAGILLSGGEDARVVLGAVPAGVRMQGFVFAEHESREVRSARRVGDAYGVPVRFVRRPPGHDLRHFEAVARMVGTQNGFIDVHGYGLHRESGLDRLPVVLGGFSSDALLKADNLGREDARRVRRGEPSRLPAAEPPPLAGVRPELLREAAARRDAHRRRLCELRPASAGEWSYIYPFGMRKYAAGVHGNRRLFRSHEPFMSNDVVRIAAGVPQRWKISRRLFHAAFRPLLAPSWYVPHTRNRFPYFPHGVNVAARPLLGAARRARALATRQLGVDQESWPVWEELVRTQLMEEKARAHPLEDSPLAGLFVEPGAAGRAVRRWSGLRRLAALQLAALTRL